MYCAEFNFCTSLSMQSYGKIRISVTESSCFVFRPRARFRGAISQSVPFPSASDIASADNVRKKVFISSARQSIDQVFTTHPACACLKAIFKSIFSYSHTSSSSVRCWKWDILSDPLPTLGVITRRIPLIRVPLSLAWHSKEIYDLTLRQPWIELHGFSARFSVVGASAYDNRNHQQDSPFHKSIRHGLWLASRSSVFPYS